MSKFDEFVKEALKQAAKLATGSLGNVKKALEEDAQSFLDLSKTNLSKWTTQLAEGKLTKLEFADLVEGEKSLAKMHALSAAGISLGETQRLRAAIIQAVISAAIATFL